MDENKQVIKVNPYDKYKIDEELKKVGVWFQDEDVMIRVTFAGTENARYDKMLKLKLKPFENQIKADNLSDKVFHKLLAEVYAATVVLEWRVKTGEDANGDSIFVDGIHDEDGEVLPFTEDNVKLGFALGNRLFQDVIKIATNFNLFRQGQKADQLKK